MGIYRQLAAQPGIFRILGAQLTARFPFGMLSIIMLLHIQLVYGDFTSAGIVLALQSVGQAVSGPLSSRLMGKFGMRPVLIVTSLSCAALLLTIGFVELPLIAVMGLAVLVGLTTPPVTPAVRTVYPQMVTGPRLAGLFSLDAAAQEIIWIAGPLVAVFVSAQFGTAAGLGTAAAFMVCGGAWFVLSPELGRIKLPPSRGGFGAVLRRPTVAISTLIGFFFVAGFAAIEAAIVAAFAEGDGHSSMESGVVLAFFAGGSLVGGLLFGHRTLRPWSILMRISVVLIGTALCLFSLNIWWLSIVLFLGGMGTAPTFAGISSIVSSTVKFSETAEAYGWVGTGQLVGVALGSAIAGIAIDTHGPTGAIFVSTMLTLASALCAALCMRWLPDLKGRTLEPLPETGTITLPLP